MNIKALEEKRNDLKGQMDAILDKAKAEVRAMTSEEIADFDKLENEIKNIDATIEREEKRNMNENKNVEKDLTVEERDVQSFANYIRNAVTGVENRAETNLAKGDNGAVIPKTIVKKIMEKVEDISPIYKLATKYHIAGIVNVPKEDNTSDTITVAYATEFTELESHSNKFATIELTGYLYGALTKISKSLLRNSNFDLTNWVVNKMAKKIAKFIEGELINGSASKVSGIVGSYDDTNMKVTLAKAGAITADELIDLQELIPDEYQADGIWVMNRATRKAIRKLKDGQGNYLLEKDSTSKWGYRLMGNDVYCSDNISALGTASKPVVMFGDFSGLAVKEGEKTEIQVLTERFATQHAVGVVAWGELDAKVEDTQKIAVAVAGSAN
jgi:HK97 family phage major capsid protein